MLKLVPIALLCVSSPAAAAPKAIATPDGVPPPPTLTVDRAPTPEALAAANRLLDAMGYEDLMRRTTQSMAAPMQAQLRSKLEEKLGKPADEELISSISDVLAKFMKASLVDNPKIRAATAVIYARHLSPAELDRMAVLYRDPAMKRFNEEIPQVMAEIMPLFQGIVQQKEKQLEAQIVAAVTTYFAAHPPQGSGS